MNSKKAVKKKLKPIPKFKTLEEEADFWDTHTFVDYFDFSKGYWGKLNIAPDVEHIFKSKKDDSVTIRLQPELIEKLKKYASSVGLSVSSVIRMWSIEKLRSV